MDRTDGNTEPQLLNNVPHVGVGHRRRVLKSHYSAEDNALDQIAKEVRNEYYSNIQENFHSVQK